MPDIIICRTYVLLLLIQSFCGSYKCHHFIRYCYLHISGGSIFRAIIAVVTFLFVFVLLLHLFLLLIKENIEFILLYYSFLNIIFCYFTNIYILLTVYCSGFMLVNTSFFPFASSYYLKLKHPQSIKAKLF